MKLYYFIVASILFLVPSNSYSQEIVDDEVKTLKEINLLLLIIILIMIFSIVTLTRMYKFLKWYFDFPPTILPQIGTENPCEDIDCCTEVQNNFTVELLLFKHPWYWFGGHEFTTTNVLNGSTTTVAKKYNNSPVRGSHSMRLTMGLPSGKNVLDPCCDPNKVSFEVTFPDGTKKNYKLSYRPMAGNSASYLGRRNVEQSPRFQSGTYRVVIKYGDKECFSIQFTITIV